MSSFFKPKAPKVPAEPAPPTLDEAAKNRDELDRIKKRRGVLANIFGGAAANAASPVVGVKTLGGA